MIHAKQPKKHKCLSIFSLGIVESTTHWLESPQNHIITWLVKIWNILVANWNEKKEESKDDTLLLFMCAMRKSSFEKVMWLCNVSLWSFQQLHGRINNPVFLLIIFHNPMEVDTCLPQTYSFTISRITFCFTTYNFWQDLTADVYTCI